MREEQGPITVLIAVESRHGSTMEIAEILSEHLYAQGIETVRRDPGEVGTLGGYDAAIIGSAVYMGRWLKPARELAKRIIAERKGRPLWLFSSGPIGAPPRPEGEPEEVAPLLRHPEVHGHRVFAGRLDRERLGR